MLENPHNSQLPELPPYVEYDLEPELQPAPSLGERVSAHLESRSFKHRFNRFGALAIAGAMTAIAAVVAEKIDTPVETMPTAAHGDYTIYRTDGDGLVLHDGAGLSAPSISVMPEGAVFRPECFRISDAVNGNPVWLEGVYNGRRGSAADYYVSTTWQTHDDLRNQGIPECDTQSAPDQTATQTDQSGLVFPVANAEGGVYSRNSPSSSDTPSITGQGVYEGDKVQLICGVTNGEAVGPHDNNTWHKVKNLSRPSLSDFWLNDHYVQSPNVADELAPGEPLCGEQNRVGATLPPRPQQPSQPVVQNPPTPIEKNDCASGIVGAVAESGAKGYLGAGEYNRDAAMNPAQNSHDFVCVRANMSESNNGERFVSIVECKAPYLQPPGCEPSFLVEIWGDGFYKKTNCTQGQTWMINKWLQTGTYVCAAVSSASDMDSFKSREEANKAVESGRIKLGENDPHRTIKCVEV